jgi:DNA (cytosine-5)-methyltransferase 1
LATTILERENRVATTRRPQPTVLDIFCGPGGLSLGFKRAGYRVVGGIDLSAPAVQTFQRNFRQSTGIVHDIRTLSANSIVQQLGTQVDVLVGGPSCQGFSTSGGLSRRSGRDLHDPRNSLFEHYLRFVAELSPPWVVFENVPGLLLYHHGEIARTICNRFNELGYVIHPIILLAADYGVAQLRRRLFFVGNRTGSPVDFPLPTHGDPELWANFALPFSFLSRLGHKGTQSTAAHISFGEACGDLPSLREGESMDNVPYAQEAHGIFQREMRRASKTVRQHIAFDLCETDRLAATILTPGQNWTNMPPDQLASRFSRIRRYDATTLMKRLTLDRPAYTITTKFNEASTGAFIHPTQNRTLSIREAARIQSFPDKFIFEGDPRQIRYQIGNAVPPLLAQAVAESILPTVLRDVYSVHARPTRETVTLDDAGINDAIQLHKARKQIKTYAKRKTSSSAVE